MFTPIKHSIPGYGNLTTKNEVEVLKQKVRKMESDIVSKDDYISAIRKIILGEKDITNYELVKDDVADTTLNEEPTEEEYQLRMDVEKKEKFSITNKNSIYSSKNLRPPLRGTISSKFDIKKDHFGIDVVAAKGTAIEAVSDGTVIMSEYSIKTGHTLVLMHENNLVTCYKHNSILLKKIGNLVKAGEAIAIIGNTGAMTDGPHLHFEMWLDGKPIDPATLINF